MEIVLPSSATNWLFCLEILCCIHQDGIEGRLSFAGCLQKAAKQMIAQGNGGRSSPVARPQRTNSWKNKLIRS